MPKKKLQPDLRYPLTDFVLYKVESRAKLASLLGYKDVRDLEKLAARHDNYKVFDADVKAKRLNGQPSVRRVQEPKQELAQVHKRLTQLFRRVKTPEYLHSAVRNRSYISNARVHLGQARLLRVDIRQFYPSTKKHHVVRFFREVLRCSPDVSELLARLCTYEGLLPTGSPLSPLLSYWTHSRMFDQLSEMASSRRLKFSCYFDDVTFSGIEVSKDMIGQVGKLFRSNGLELHPDKSKFYRLNSPKLVTGVIVRGLGIALPYERYRNIREFKKAFANCKNSDEKLHLAERLNGMLGEAAQIEPTMMNASLAMRAELLALREKKELRAP